ncbi:MAG: molybdopterin-dependent oxidoreductase, partial [Rhodospirillaceae bacterium]
KRIQIEPHLSVTGANSAEWVPIKPKTDAAFMMTLIHVMLHERPRPDLDLHFLKHHTSSPYLVGPNGFFLRDPETEKPLVWDETSDRAVPFDTPGIEPRLDGAATASGIELGADDERWTHDAIPVHPSFALLVELVRERTPDWAAEVCEVETVRRLANAFVDHARVGETIEIDGRVLPFRPVAVTLGKTVNNGWGGFDCCWARTMLACLVGALEVPGGTLGTTVRLNRPATSRQASVKPTNDGLMDYPMNPTDAKNWQDRPAVRNAHRTLVPLSANSPWSQALGPTHLAWMLQSETPEHFPEATPPDIWIVYRTNPSISFWDTGKVVDTIANFPFTICFAYTPDETNHLADILLPDCTDLESLQLIRIGGTKYVEQFWDHQGFALRQPAVAAAGEARDFTWIATQFAKAAGLLPEYNAAINRGAQGVRLKTDAYDFSLDEGAEHGVEEIWDRTCRAASAELTGGADNHGLDYFKEHGYRSKPFSRLNWYLFPALADQGLRFELPYQERLYRVGKQLANRLHERDIHWWDKQLAEYTPMPECHDLPALWERALADNFNVDIGEFPFWLLTARSMQYAWGGNADIQVIKEVAGNVAG